MTETAAAVKVDRLARVFGSFTAVDNISFEVKRGEVFGFLGPNGAGKSTTIKMLCGLLLPTSGKGTVGGFDIMTESEDIKRSIGYMSQRFSLYEDLTVEENINFFSGIYGVAGARKKEKKEWALEMAGLKDKRGAITKTLAGGFKQRLALGCAILHEPPIIFLDEPTSGVDPVSRRNFWALIYRLSQAGTTVFVTTHYMDEAEYCDRLALIYRGRIISEGTPEGLKTTGIKHKVLEIETDKPFEAVEALIRNGMEAALFGNAIHANAGPGKDPSVAAGVLAKDGIRVNRLEEIKPSLEDVFVTLIEES